MSSSGVNRNEINYNEKPKYILTREEAKFIHTQLCIRKYYFEEEVKNSREIKRIKECINAMEIIDSILNKLLGMM